MQANRSISEQQYEGLLHGEKTTVIEGGPRGARSQEAAGRSITNTCSMTTIEIYSLMWQVRVLMMEVALI
ncbi:hypothetical protein Y1Q_0011764 [Alligator mississippiensis]|uniref:Uncharacterized protein n=1 Tax=Alligator mississippiensis TaxID=8496 RepID=A0A151M111_ALLMI|nr:hypothetical protein Y1Q_0011764 [Alligator mississippiensis]